MPSSSSSHTPIHGSSSSSSHHHQTNSTTNHSTNSNTANHSTHTTNNTTNHSTNHNTTNHSTHQTNNNTTNHSTAGGVLVPPLNFAMVAPAIYRSGYPNKKNFPFLKELKLKSIMYICDDDHRADNIEFMKENHIKSFHYRSKGNKEPFQELDQSEIANALVQVLDQRNHPMLIHCNKGKHRVGCLVGCLRKLQHWSMTSIFDEYQRFAGVKLRIADQEFIEVFKAPVEFDDEQIPKWLNLNHHYHHTTTTTTT